MVTVFIHQYQQRHGSSGERRRRWMTTAVAARAAQVENQARAEKAAMASMAALAAQVETVVRLDLAEAEVSGAAAEI